MTALYSLKLNSRDRALAKSSQTTKATASIDTMQSTADRVSRLDSVEMETQQQVGITYALHRLLDKLADILLGKRKVTPTSSVIETAKTREWTQNSVSVNENSYGTFEDPDEKETCESLSKRIFETLRTAKEVKLDCEMYIPCNLTLRIAQDIMRMSECEPCGIRGCTTFITMEDGRHIRKLGKIAVDPDTVATFEIHLTLQRIDKTFFSLTFPTCLKFAHRNSITVSPGFRLIKNKLYRSPVLTIK
ncbi:DNA damage-inducible transcript 4-like protein [Saccoglossus kowalevskii]|uniref:Protein scylla-like n=1 Tax=Saccoglossus kowalevskii TaxID=10224 RepID=A0ABM0GXZ1_SACKO|nr:PREDICTED: protein scylla-like [Saccoglossus kowalevskii]